MPSGNFGNLTAGLFAKRMGLPVKRFIAANNENDVVFEYLQTGKYTPRPSVQTIANAMDVGDPSNFVRILDLYDHSWENICADLSGVRYSDDEIRDTIKIVYKKDKYVLDPHGATGCKALIDGLEPGEAGVFLETAHPAKFMATVEPLVGKGNVPVPERLAKFMEGVKNSIPMSKEFKDFKDFLLNI